MVPFDTESPFVTTGIRIGAPAMTTRGLNEIDFTRIARLIDRIICNPESNEVISGVKQEVHDICRQYPLYDFVTTA